MKSKTLSLIFYVICLEIYYNFWNFLSTWLFLLTNTMITIDNSSNNVINTNNDNNMFTVNSNTHVNFTDNNSHDYFSFDMHLVLNYINNQFIYYYIFSIISAAEQACFQQLMKQHKIFLKLLEWNNMFDEMMMLSKKKL